MAIYPNDKDARYEAANNKPYPYHTYMEDSEQAYVTKWLTNQAHFNALRDNLGADFKQGARFVPICGDGNCFFSAVSVSLTACKEKPFGTKAMHSSLRKRVCDFIVQQSKTGTGDFA